MKKFFILLSMLFFLIVAGAERFVAVKNGVPECVIVTGKNPDRIITLAAKELQKFIKEISGAQIEITASASADRKQIRLAVGRQYRQLDNNDGYAVQGNGRYLQISAATPKGVLNGVYRTLARDTGIIWARPDEKNGTVFRKQKNISFDPQFRFDVPVFLMRGWHTGCRSRQELTKNELFLTRNCVNWIASTNDIRRRYGNITEFGLGHNLTSVYIPEAEYYDTHPEYFALINGRHPRQHEMVGGTQLCFTNEEVAELFIRRLDKFVRENPDNTVFRIIAEDNNHVCTCKKCLEPLKLPDGRKIDGRKLKPGTYGWRQWRSTQYFIFLNRIARFMQQNHPGKRIMTLAYFFTEVPPLVKLEKNIDISFCPIDRDSRRAVTAAENKMVMDNLSRWLEITPNVVWREYYGLNVEYPRPIDRMAFEDLAYLAKRGVRRTYSEITADTPLTTYRRGDIVWDLGAPFLWSLIQAPWNPARKVEDVRREYYVKVFGVNAAPHMERFYAAVEKAWYASSRRSVWNDHLYPLWDDFYRDRVLVKKCLAELEAALPLTDTPQGREMVKKLLDHFKYCGFPEPAETIRIPRAEGKVAFDWKFDNAVWQKAATVTELYDFDGKLCPYKQTIRIIHDGKYIHVGMHAIRPGLAKLLDPSKNYCQAETLDVFFALNDRPYQDHIHGMVDPLNRIHFSAAAVRQVPGFPWKYQAKYQENEWCAMVSFPIDKLAKNLKIGIFRRYDPAPRPGVWPNSGAGLKNSAMHQTPSFAPVILLE